MPKNFVFIDLETTGTNATYHRIIEIGLIRVEDGREVARYQTLVNPETWVSPFIQDYTGIRAEDLTSAPTFSSIKDEVYELLRDAVFVAHNVRFDYGFLKWSFFREGLSFQAKQLCTVKLARRLDPAERRNNLDAVIARYNLSCPSRHRAFDDAAVLWQFMGAAEKRHGIEVVTNHVRDLLHEATTPVHLSQEDLDRVPEAPGVYIFRGEKDYPLYVGKSINLRERVQSHFTNDSQTGRHLQMCQQVRRVEVQQTAGELGALLTESQLIKQLQPLYNRLLRRSREMVVLRQHELNGYLVARYARESTIAPDSLGNIIGLYESEVRLKEAVGELAANYQLCPQLLGLEKGGARCFSAQLGKCYGACVGTEMPLRYNLRFTTAFGKAKLQAWPFRGAIAITENAADGRSEKIIVDQWCLLGRLREDFQSDEESARFDFDTYKIIRRFVLNPVNQARIHQLEVREAAV